MGAVLRLFLEGVSLGRDRVVAQDARHLAGRVQHGVAAQPIRPPEDKPAAAPRSASAGTSPGTGAGTATGARWSSAVVPAALRALSIWFWT